MKRFSNYAVLFVFSILMLMLPSCSPSGNAANDINRANDSASADNIKTDKIYFIELGSDGCKPCRMMRPVMEKVAENYKDKVEVIFYDVNTVQGGPKAQEYGIRVIPTQIFLDAEKKEIFRHEGFYPYENIKSLLDGWLK